MTVQKKIQIKRYCVYLAILLLAHLFQNCIRIFPEIGSVRPILLISAAVCISMFEGELVGAVVGLIAGALWDTVTVTADGYNAMFLMIACALCGTMLRIFLRNNIVTYVMMNVVITTIYSLSYALFFVTARGVKGAIMMYFTYYWPMVMYSLVFTPFWYYLVRAVNRKFSYNYIEY